MSSTIREARQAQSTRSIESSAAGSEHDERHEQSHLHSPKKHSVRVRSVRHAVNRAQFEDDFLRSQSSDRIAREYGISDDDSPANPHADPTGHYERLHLISALDR